MSKSLVLLIPNGHIKRQNPELWELPVRPGEIVIGTGGDPLAVGISGDASLDETGAFTLKAIRYELLPAAVALVHQARGVVTSNVSDLSQFTGVAGGTSVDGLTYAAGDRVLLVGQTTAAQNGLYAVGSVAGGVAPLSRLADWATGQGIINGSVVEVSEGSLWGGATFKTMCTGARTIDTDDPQFYPRHVRRTISLNSGSATLAGATDLMLLSASASSVSITRNTGAGAANTVAYSAPGGSRSAGVVGTASVVVQAELSTGLVNTADNSTLDVVVTNW